LEFDAVDLDAENGTARDALPALVCNFNDEPDTILQRPTILGCAAIGGGGEELREEVPMRTVQLDAVVASFFEKLRCVRGLVDDSRYLGLVAACGLANVMPITLPGLLVTHALYKRQDV
jgi:hypothetical protein